MKQAKKEAIAEQLMAAQKKHLKQRGGEVSDEKIAEYAAALKISTKIIRSYFQEASASAKKSFHKISYGILKILTKKQWGRWNGTFDDFFEYTDSDEEIEGASKEEIKSVLKEFIQ